MNDTQPDTTSTAPAGARFHPMVGPVPPLRVGPRSDGGDALWIHPDGAAEVVRTLNAVAERLRRLDKVCDDLRVVPASADEVSTNVAAQANLMAERARAFNTAWQLQIQGPRPCSTSSSPPTGPPTNSSAAGSAGMYDLGRTATATVDPPRTGQKVICGHREPQPVPVRLLIRGAARSSPPIPGAGSPSTRCRPRPSRPAG